MLRAQAVAEEWPLQTRVGRAPPPGAVTRRQDLPVRLADPVIGLDGVFLIYVLFAVRPTCSGINVWLLEGQD